MSAFISYYSNRSQFRYIIAAKPVMCHWESVAAGSLLCDVAVYSTLPLQCTQHSHCSVLYVCGGQLTSYTPTLLIIAKWDSATEIQQIYS